MAANPLEDLIVRRSFNDFQDGLRSRFHAFGLQYTLTYCDPSDDPAMRLDFGSKAHMGRVTAWVSGACDLEVLDARDGRQLMWEHHDVATDAEFIQVCAKVPVLMRDLRNRSGAS